MLDIDDTLLSDFPYNVWTIALGQHYPTGWKAWLGINSIPNPGALDFVLYAKRRDVAIFYITNRKPSEKADTIKDLKAAGFPVGPHNVIVHEEGRERSKIASRRHVTKDHRIVLMIGDSLEDFSGIFDHLAREGRNNAVDRKRESFGKKFIIVPNPVHGRWEELALPHKKKEYDGKGD